MTRVNVGIEPLELCDQHLIAEIHELPRCFAHSGKRGPHVFTLGKGHVLWCAKFQGSLYRRLAALVLEAKLRGFQITEYEAKKSQEFWTSTDEMYARGFLIERINTRLISMIKKPRWTGRQPPTWATQALALHVR